MHTHPNRKSARRLATAAMLALTLAACGSADGGSSTDAGVSGERTGSASSSTGSSAGEPAPDAGPVATPPHTYSDDPVVVENQAEGQLVAVEADSGGGVDRLTFRFSGAAPGYRVELVPRLTAGPEGEVVAVNGESFLRVTFSSTTPNVDNQLSEDVPTNSDFDLPLLRQVVLVHNVAGDLWFGVGLAPPEPTFRVVTAEDPTRIVVEVQGG